MTNQKVQKREEIAENHMNMNTHFSIGSLASSTWKHYIIFHIILHYVNILLLDFYIISVGIYTEG